MTLGGGKPATSGMTSEEFTAKVERFKQAVLTEAKERGDDPIDLILDRWSNWRDYPDLQEVARAAYEEFRELMLLDQEADDFHSRAHAVGLQDAAIDIGPEGAQ